jgi:bifunctional ADP-heptose synthase (sugar kinase/adenylyltransferase)
MDTLLQKKFSILLLGDNCTDVYQYGTVDRISPEAPVPVFKFSHKENLPGMAGNVNENLKALGCDVHFMHTACSTKTRLIDIRSKQHIVRIDDDAECTPLEFVVTMADQYDAVVISDYNKGTVSYQLVEQLRKDFNGPIFVDTKKTDLSRFEGCFVKINALEHSLVKSVCSELIVTNGKDGAVYQGHTQKAPQVEVTDVCGAGDTFLAALAVDYLNTHHILTSIAFANKAAAITVQHIGVYAPTLKEIKCQD